MLRTSMVVFALAVSALGTGIARAQPDPANAAVYAWSGIAGLEPPFIKRFPRNPLPYTAGPYLSGDGAIALVEDGSYYKAVGPYTPTANTSMMALWSVRTIDGAPHCVNGIPACSPDNLTETRWPDTVTPGDLIIPKAMSTTADSVVPSETRVFVTMQAPGIDGRPDIVTNAYSPDLVLLWSNRYSFPWCQDPRQGADIPIAVLSPDGFFDRFGFSWPIGAPVAVVGRSLTCGVGEEVVLLLYENSAQGTPVFGSRRWGSATEPASDVPVAAAMGVLPVAGQPFGVPVVYVVGNTLTGSSKVFLVAFYAPRENNPIYPKPGSLVAGFPQFIDIAGREESAAGIAVTRDGIYIAGATRTTPTALDGRIFSCEVQSHGRGHGVDRPAVTERWRIP